MPLTHSQRHFGAVNPTYQLPTKPAIRKFPINRRTVLTGSLLLGSRAAATLPAGLFLVPSEGDAQERPQEDESCDVLPKIAGAARENRDAAVLFNVLQFICPEPPRHPSAEFRVQHWERAREVYNTAINEIYPYPLAFPPLVRIQFGEQDFETILLLFEPLPSYRDFLALEATIFAQIGNGGLVFKIIAKLLAVLGIDLAPREAQNLAGLLVRELGPLFDDLLNHLLNSRFRRAWNALGAILDALTSRRITQALARAIGRAGATRFFARLGARLLPFVGWAVLIASLLVELGAQVFL